jgi:predicted dehydrogenase
MAQAIKVGIIGAGWPGLKHVEGYRATGGFQIAAVSDLIPSRRKGLAQQAGTSVAEHADFEAILKDANIGAVSICLPNHLHAPVALKALKAGKHVLCETPPTLDAAEAKKLAAAAEKAGKVLLFAAQRRFGGAEQAARQAIEKGYAGDVYHARASWMRTRGIPAGTGWYTDKSKSGGGAMIDTGLQVLDLAWYLMGRPKPLSAFAVMPRKLAPQAAAEGSIFDVEEAASVMVRFEGDKSLELSTSWAINQAPLQQGTLCRLHGDKGALEVYTPKGPVMYRSFGPKGEAKETPLKLPKMVLYPAMIRHFKQCILGVEQPVFGGADAVALMAMVDAIYKSAGSGKSASL